MSKSKGPLVTSMNSTNVDDGPAGCFLRGSPLLSVVHDPGSEERQELTDPRRVRWPCWRGDQVAVCHGGIDGDIGIFAVCQFDLRAAGG